MHGPEKRGQGHGTMTVHRGGRIAELPLVDASHNLDPRSVRQVCEALGLDWSRLSTKILKLSNHTREAIYASKTKSFNQWRTR